MSTFGTTYVARPRSEVLNGSTTRQYGFCSPPSRAEDVVVVTRVVWVATTFGQEYVSGRTARMAQLSCSLRPVLVPPCTVSPFRSRALTPTSTPCQFSICLPKLLASCASCCSCPTLPGTRL